MSRKQLNSEQQLAHSKRARLCYANSTLTIVYLDMAARQVSPGEFSYSVIRSEGHFLAGLDSSSRIESVDFRRF